MNDASRNTLDTLGGKQGVALFAASAEDARHFGEQLLRLGYSSDMAMSGGITAAIGWTSSNPPPAVLLVDLDGDSLPLQSINDLLEVCDPACQIIALGSRQDIDLYRTLLQHGIFDYLTKPVPLDLLASSLSRAQGHAIGETSAVRSGRTIAVTGVSGGCGSSTIAAGLAQLLSTQRHSSTALVDFDRSNGDLALLLGYDGDAGLAAALASEEIDARFLQRAMGQVNERLFLLAQEPSLHTDTHLSTELLLTLGASLCRMFNQVIWDLPAGRPQGSLDVLAHAQTRILLTDFTVQDARNTHRLLREIGDESAGQQLLLVANPSRNGQPGVVERSQFEEFVGRPIDLILPHAGQALSDSLLTGPLRLESAAAFQSTLLDLADLACGRPLRKQVVETGLVGRLKNVLTRNRSAA
ncbi:histidine kinase [Pseudomonas sp. ABC1]|uniref:cellulose synthase operon protein YhjQ/BcsQ n=1 Tax=Pseudomonas sp. ABC1 TaxID=2748080 RepID=UPI0015C31CC1|nr:cellulose synthase operon protein YhjQ/BcsQ [Pseudomonas sp. ABC1]QLF92010.1 histidine kinase [Pseudomonas sp. ABC1]